MQTDNIAELKKNISTSFALFGMWSAVPWLELWRSIRLVDMPISVDSSSSSINENGMYCVNPVLNCVMYTF